MKHIIAAALLIITCITALGQDKVTEEIKKLSESKSFDPIITQYAARPEALSAKALYYVGHAYFMKEDDANCLKFLNLSISKDPTDPMPYSLKGSALTYMDNFAEAIPAFNEAVRLKPDDAVAYSGLGDAYYNLKQMPEALEAFKKATLQPKCPNRPFFMAAQIYFSTDQHDKALEAFYIVKPKLEKKGDMYLNTLFNIGLLESLKGDYDKAEPVFAELIQLNPKDYHAYAKLIQVYYHRKEYKKAQPYKDKLYQAHKAGQLKGTNLEDMFCFDQFLWNNYRVLVFERYEEPAEGKKDIYNKHVFYVHDKNDKEVLRVQTEYSPVSIELKGPAYILCATKGNMHINSGIGFDEGFEYDDLKATVIPFIEKNIK